MAIETTPRGVPYPKPGSGEPNNPPVHFKQQAEWIDANVPKTADLGDPETEAGALLLASIEDTAGQRVQAAGGVVTPGQNTIAGYSGNAVASDLGTATINGGGTVGRENVIGLADASTIGTTTPNVAATGTGANYSVITGGYDNGAGGLMSMIGGAHNYTLAASTHGTISGGSLHHIDAGDYHVIAGGTVNSINTVGGSRCTIGGGSDNSITGVISGATIAGGRSNVASASQASIGGGLSNTASGDRSTIAGGNSNQASAQYASVGGGSGNVASGQRSSVGGGSGNQATGQNAAIAGGGNCQANTSFSTVAGGELNIVGTSTHGTISGGKSNSATGQYAAIAGGDLNTASGANAFVAGGSNNDATGNYGHVSGLRAKASRYGQRSHAAGFFAAKGDAQISDLVMRRVTTDATATELRIDGGSTRLVLDDDTSWAFTIAVVARNTATDAESAAYHFRGGIRRGAGVGTTALIGTVDALALEDVSGWDCTVTADATNGALSIRGTGEAGKNIQWVARVALTETTG